MTVWALLQGRAVPEGSAQALGVLGCRVGCSWDTRNPGAAHRDRGKGERVQEREDGVGTSGITAVIPHKASPLTLAGFRPRMETRSVQTHRTSG